MILNDKQGWGEINLEKWQKEKKLFQSLTYSIFNLWWNINMTTPSHANLPRTPGQNEIDTATTQYVFLGRLATVWLCLLFFSFNPLKFKHASLPMRPS